MLKRGSSGISGRASGIPVLISMYSVRRIYSPPTYVLGLRKVNLEKIIEVRLSRATRS
jgi:hypothetical protein